MTWRERAEPHIGDTAATALFVAMAVAWWWPLPLHLTTGQLEDPPIDAAFNQWILGWGVHALTTDPLAFFDANMFHPFEDVLAWGDHLFGLALLGLPLVPLFGVLGAYNTLLVATSAASGFTAYKLGSEVAGDKATGVLAGVLWAFCSARVLELTHLQILATQWIPLVFLFAERWCGPKRRKLHVVLLAVAVWLVLAANVYLAMYTLLGFGVWSVVAIAAGRAHWRRIPGLAVAWIAAGIAALPLYLPALAVQAEMGVRRGLDEQSGARLDALLPLPLPGRTAQDVFGLVDPARFRYDTIGLVTIALVVVALASAASRRWRPKLASYVPYVAVGVVGIASAQGPTFQWGQDELTDNPVFLIAYHLVPGYDALRVPARWFPVVGLLGIVVFALAGARPLLDVAARRTPALRVVLVALVAAFVLFEQSPAPLRVSQTYALADYPAYEWLADATGENVILELPISADLGSVTTQQVEGKRMYLSTFHWQRRVNGGISPVIDRRYGPRALVLDRLGEDPAAVDLLRRYNVRYVLVLDEDFAAYGRTDADADAVRARLAAAPWVRRVRDFRGGATVFETTFAE